MREMVAKKGAKEVVELPRLTPRILYLLASVCLEVSVNIDSRGEIDIMTGSLEAIPAGSFLILMSN